MKSASVKQIKFAESIAECLNIRLPVDQSSFSYHRFISSHLNEFNEKAHTHDDPAFDYLYEMSPDYMIRDGGGDY